MVINLWAILACAVLSIVIGAIWYGPVFGKKWMQITNADALDMEARKKMMKGVWKLYLTQFILSLLQILVLAVYTALMSPILSSVNVAFSFWLAFIVPTIAASAMWNNDSAKISWARFFIQASYQLICFALFGYILGKWM